MTKTVEIKTPYGATISVKCRVIQVWGVQVIVASEYGNYSDAHTSDCRLLSFAEKTQAIEQCEQELSNAIPTTV